MPSLPGKQRGVLLPLHVQLSRDHGNLSESRLSLSSEFTYFSFLFFLLVVRVPGGWQRPAWPKPGTLACPCQESTGFAVYLWSVLCYLVVFTLGSEGTWRMAKACSAKAWDSWAPMPGKHLLTRRCSQ